MQLINTISNSRTWTRHAVKIAYGASAFLLILVIAGIAWNIKFQSQVKVANYSKQTIAPISKKAKFSYKIENIVSANLFGDPSPKLTTKVAPKTTLDLTLQGVLSASNNAMARAIIMSGKHQSKLYSIGDSIQGAGVSIEEIKPNEVLLNRNGAIESLPLNTLKSKGGNDSSIITYSRGSSGQVSNSALQRRARADSQQTIRSMTKPRSANGQPRKIRKPNFSGLDRALQKMGEI
ncbi:MAG: type II secretion system protein C [Arenicella sp.]|jgi:type II secretion system protein C